MPLFPTLVYPDSEGVVWTVDVHLRPQDNRDTLLPYKPKPLTVLQMGVQCQAEDLPKPEVEEEND